MSGSSQPLQTGVVGERIAVATPDGQMDAYLFWPADDAAHPLVVVYMDAFGIRPELAGMAERLAAGGYVVALPNLYYRTGPFPPFDPHQVSTDGPERVRFKSMIASISDTLVMRDTRALLAHLDGLSGVGRGGLAVIGYCMGGGFALSAAGTFPDRVVAAASFHGGSLATDKPDSPHRLAAAIRGRVYVGVAEFDQSFGADQRDRLERAFRDAGVHYTLELYPGARHGFAVTGHLAYDRDASERHWERVFQLLADAFTFR